MIIQGRQTGKTTALLDKLKYDYLNSFYVGVSRNGVLNYKKRMPRHIENRIEYYNDFYHATRGMYIERLLLDDILFLSFKEQKNLIRQIRESLSSETTVLIITTADQLYYEEDIMIGKFINSNLNDFHDVDSFINSYERTTSHYERDYDLRELIFDSFLCYPNIKIINENEDLYNNMGKEKTMTQLFGFHLKKPDF